MYIPHAYRNDNRDELVAFMQANSFATLISVVDGAPIVSHVPLIVSLAGDEVIIRGHLAKANPLCEALDGREALAIFHGPHAYISPSLYDKYESVPTWNYIAVHATGIPRATQIGEQPGEVETMLRDMIATYEPAYQQQWESLDARFRDGMLRVIVGFSMTVTHLEGKYKLSQNRSDADRTRVAHALLESADPVVAGVGEAMLHTFEHPE
jgi:transcriptional regulator